MFFNNKYKNIELDKGGKLKFKNILLSSLIIFPIISVLFFGIGHWFMFNEGYNEIFPNYYLFYSSWQYFIPLYLVFFLIYSNKIKYEAKIASLFALIIMFILFYGLFIMIVGLLFISKNLSPILLYSTTISIITLNLFYFIIFFKKALKNVFSQNGNKYIESLKRVKFNLSRLPSSDYINMQEDKTKLSKIGESLSSVVIFLAPVMSGIVGGSHGNVDIGSSYFAIAILVLIIPWVQNFLATISATYILFGHIEKKYNTTIMNGSKIKKRR